MSCRPNRLIPLQVFGSAQVMRHRAHFQIKFSHSAETDFGISGVIDDGQWMRSHGGDGLQPRRL